MFTFYRNLPNSTELHARRKRMNNIINKYQYLNNVKLSSDIMSEDKQTSINRVLII